MISDEDRKHNNEIINRLLLNWGRSSWLHQRGPHVVHDLFPMPGSPERERLIRRAKAYLEKERIAIEGRNGSDPCYHVAGICHDGFGLEEDECLEAMADWNTRCQPPWSEKELRHKIDSVRKKGGPRGHLANAEPPSRATVNGAPVWPVDSGEKVPDGPLIIRASEITPRKVEWLWPWRIPLGKMTTFAGIGGLGKTFTLCDIAARVSRGADWPDLAGECCEPGQVLYISGEDDPEDTLVPRLIQLGADLGRVSFFRSEVQGHFTLAATQILSAAVDQVGPDTKMVVIDPPTGYLGDVNDHRNAELRRLLTPLQAWAAARRIALVFNTHVNKPQGVKVDAMMRVMGSVAWVNAVRAAHMFARDPEEPDRRLFVPMKLNIGRERKGLAYRIKILPDDQATIEWLGEVDTTADEAVNHTPGTPRRVVAAEWLVDCFRQRLEWPSDVLFRAAHEANVSRNAVFEAKKILKLPKARRVTHQNGDEEFIWWVPADWPPLAREAAQADAKEF